MMSKIRHFLTSHAFLPFPLLFGMIGLLGGDMIKIVSMLANAYLVTLVLFLSDDLLPALLPAFCVITVGVTLLDRLEVVVPYIPLAIPVVVAFVFHLIRHSHRPRVGYSLVGLIVTSAAVLISGIGTHPSTRDYTSGAAIYHLIGLSVGLIILYLLFAVCRPPKRNYDPIHYFLAVLTVLGVLCAAVVFDGLLEWMIETLNTSAEEINWSPKAYFDDIMYRNTISTLAVMCIPAAFYMAKRAKRIVSQSGFFLIGLIIYLGAVLTFARTALIFGSILLLICFVYYFWGRDAWTAKSINLALLLISLVVLLIIFWEPFSSILHARLPKGWLSTREARMSLMIRSFDDFRAHPFFGIGITSTANSDIYSAQHCICWYHLYFPQIWGSMGLAGIVAYTVQFILRAKLVFTKPDIHSIALGLVYLGLFLYSQTDPGEFAPIPYAVLIIPLFMLLEERRRVILSTDNDISEKRTAE